MSIDVIGLGGLKQSGKDTVAEFLVKNHEYKRLAFADHVRKMCLALDPLIPGFEDVGLVRLSDVVHDYGWDRAKELFPEVRRLMQYMGTEVGRQLIYEDFWVDTVALQLTPGEKFVITDVRFPNEIALMKSIQATTIWIDRPDNSSGSSNHASENSVSSKDFANIIVNDATLLDLENTVARFLEEQSSL